jgi:ATPase family associated with various cellular activities (AAA)
MSTVTDWTLTDVGDRFGPLAERLRTGAADGGSRWAGAGDWPALSALARLFGLTTFERELLGLCAAVELDPSLAAACADAHGDPSRPHASFALALAQLAEPHWSALSPGGPLRHWRLLELDPQPTVITGPFAIDERILHFLLGVHHLDAKLDGLIGDYEGERRLAPSQALVVQRLGRELQLRREAGEWPLLALVGPSADAKGAVASAICDHEGWRLREIRAASLPGDPRELGELRRRWEREAALSSSALLIDADDCELDPSAATRLAQFAARLEAVVIVQCTVPLTAVAAGHEAFVDRPTAAERSELWRAALGDRAGELNGTVQRVARQFDLDLAAVSAASQSALVDSGGGSLDGALWQACRERSRPALDDLAQRIESVARWDELVLPLGQLDTLREIVAQVRRRAVVYDDWGFAAKGSRGLGITALFSGVSGTGKTMAAEVLAGELELDLYRIDLSSVVSKYIGETEKNLRQVFDAADVGGAILLFDEADALFGKRTEVKDSHDRYANIEVSYLLQRMEAYRGLAILTTNLKDGVDPAFLRRLRFVVNFPFPDVAARQEIWRLIFPSAVPREDLELSALARLNVSGGNIRNIALGAAFLAADGDEPVRMAHLLRAARSEYGKLERPLSASEIGGWG